MRSPRYPKPEKPVKERKRLKRSTKPIARGARPRSKVPKALGDYGERVKYANELWRKLIYRKCPDGICPNCRQRAWHDGAHGFPKGPYPWMRFELDNGIPLCRACHDRVDYDFHAKRELWLRFIGPEAFARLFLMAQVHSKLDLRLVTMYLEQKTKEAESGRTD